MSIIWFLVIGLVAGLIARALMPGKQAMGWLATLVLGVVGSFVGGLIGSLFTRGDWLELRPAGLIMSVIGAIVVLFLYSWAQRGRRVHA
ncbi:MAG TPA: GlsB/YeaQ/YmgE family stress response membrane protein [Myxococcaceae bacterium]|nr:GlsB/YeaQ/YmgE family stress response membrane protein [Myxococcaceae bacterium]